MSNQNFYRKNLIHLTLFLMLIYTYFSTEYISQENKFVIGCRDIAGLFSNLFGVINQLIYCEKYGLIPVVYWNDSSAYYSGEFQGNSNVWEYYFEPVSLLRYDQEDFINNIYWPLDQTLIDKVIHGYKYFVFTDPFTIKEHRKYIKENFIDKYIRIKPYIQEKIDDFYADNIEHKKTIGIHLRGLNFHVKNFDLEILFDKVNEFTSQGYQIFVVTASSKLLEIAKNKISGEVIFYPCERVEDEDFFNMQYIQKNNDFNRREQGESVIAECLLLSKCEKIIHTTSNIPFAALYFNPDLEYIFYYPSEDGLIIIT